jgi:hypothetical protein
MPEVCSHWYSHFSVVMLCQDNIIPFRI